ncbi:uncharacterized protein L203_105569 [Cryptococcus depauperatus CBS 7841]|uniref:Uncharacterized protein n=1 Tax=Cryptococcus depauperatus CBS 7841 TaxID=1295531 RepID=A0AAJ8JXM1_9TREE
MEMLNFKARVFSPREALDLSLAIHHQETETGLRSLHSTFSRKNHPCQISMSINSSKYGKASGAGLTASSPSLGNLGETIEKKLEQLNKKVDEKSGELLEELGAMSSRIEALEFSMQTLVEEPIERSSN